jgi:hypothetical protein
VAHPGPPAPYDPWRSVPPPPGEGWPPPDEWPHAGSGSPQVAAPPGPIDSPPTNPSWPSPVQYLPGAFPSAPARRVRWGLIVLAAGGLILVVVVGLVVRSGLQPSRGERPASGNQIHSTAELKPGTCFAQAPANGGGYADRPVVACSSPHASEVVGTFTMPKGTFPGLSGIAPVAEEKCPRLLDKYVDKSIDTSTVRLGLMGPRRDQWDAGDRVVACLAVDPSGKRQGSIKG